MKFCDLGAHLHTELCIQIRQRLVHQEYLRIPYDGASHGHSLSLTAGKGFRLPVQVLLQAQDSCRVIDSLINLRLGDAAHLQAESHIVPHRQMGIQGVILKYHGNIPVLGSHCIHNLPVNLKGPFRDILQSGDHSERRGFSASRGTDKNDKFFVLNIQIKILYRFKTVRILLINVFQSNAGHNSTLSLFSSAALCRLPSALLFSFC